MLRALLDPTRVVTFEPADDTLEYFVHTSGGTVQLTVFHHGALGQPAGFGTRSEAWTGTVSVRYKSLTGETPRGLVALERVPSGTRRVDMMQDISGVSMQVEIDGWFEVVILPDRGFSVGGDDASAQTMPAESDQDAQPASSSTQ